MIDEYAASISAKLAFDPALAQRLRAEIADHLYEAADRISPEAENREELAIQRFGHCDGIIREFTRLSWDRTVSQQIKILAVSLAVVFFTMRIRSSYFSEAILLDSSSGLVDALLVLVDRYAFALSMVAAVCYGIFQASRLGWLSWVRLDAVRARLNRMELHFGAVIVGVALLNISAISGAMLALSSNAGARVSLIFVEVPVSTTMAFLLLAVATILSLHLNRIVRAYAGGRSLLI